MKRGFTLIELLVVVLIIGILSAIALPQYEKAVFRSRVSGVWSVLKTLEQAKDAYCLENPTATYVSVSNLPVDVKQPDWSIEVFGGGRDVNGNQGTAIKCKDLPVRAYNYKLIPGKTIYLSIHNGRRYCGDSSSGNDCKKAGILGSISAGDGLSNWQFVMSSPNVYID